jgi:hypothetical protein
VHLRSKLESPAGSRRSSHHQSSRHKKGGHGERECSSQRDRNGDHHRGRAHTSTSRKHCSSPHYSRSRSTSQSQSSAGSLQSSHYRSSSDHKSSHRERERSSHTDRVGDRERGRVHTPSPSHKHYRDGSRHRDSSKHHYRGVGEVAVDPKKVSGRVVIRFLWLTTSGSCPVYEKKISAKNA